MNVSEITKAILSSNLTNEDLQLIRQATSIKHDTLARVARFSFKVGQDVYFNSKRGKITGTIQKINPKTIIVKQSDAATRWTVTASLIKAA